MWISFYCPLKSPSDFFLIFQEFQRKGYPSCVEECPDEKTKRAVRSLPEAVPARSEIAIQTALLFEARMSDQAPAAQ
jgi:hypothetical protein